jgi:hypothetical protein
MIIVAVSNPITLNKMMTTTTLHIASSLLLLPYGLLCVYGIKAKLDQDVSETELVEEEQAGTFVACWFDVRSIFGCSCR